MQNPFIWHDLMTSDVEGAKKYYGEVVGWTYSQQMPNYVVTQVDGAGMGGIMDTPPEMKGMPAVWTGYVYTPDVDTACKQAVQLGGKIYKEAWTVPDVGRMAVIADPTGAGFMIMQPLSTEQRAMPKAGSIGTVGWNELHAGDLNKAWDFYSAMFGWAKGHGHDMGPEGIYQMFQVDGKDLGGMMKKMDTMPMPTWVYYFMVDGMEAAVARITKAGGKVAYGPMEVPGGQWTVHGIDPQGGHFALLSNTK